MRCKGGVAMTYERFEDLPVWKAAMDLAEKIYSLTDAEAFKKRRSLRDQVEREALSVSNNIAGGFERGTTPELLTFLYIARGSAGKVSSILCFLERLPAFRDLKSHTEGVGRQLRGWADSLQNSDIGGQRHLNEKEEREQDDFMKELESYTKRPPKTS